ncbi:MAG: hypothetical protein P8046_08575 [Anaerolineales bacterium]|jgi:hypothetical protein
MNFKKVNVSALGRLPEFCYAVIAGDFIHVSGTFGTKLGSMELYRGGHRGGNYSGPSEY